VGPVRRSVSALRARGDVTRAALLAGIPLALCLIVWACWPQPYYTGTNSVRTRGFVAQVAAGETLCVRDLRLPAGTGLVELELVTDGEPPSMRLDLRTPGGTSLARSSLRRDAGPGPPRSGEQRSKVAFAIAERPERPATMPVDACVTPQREVTFGGMLALGGTGPTIDGRPVAGAAQVAVWFRPPAGSKRSLVSQLPVVFERASVFRPPWVGGWTYWLLLGLVLPLTFALALFLLARAQALSWRALGGGVFAVALALGLSWALLTPPFQAPDEQDHFAYVQQLAENGRTASATDATLAPWSTSVGIGLQGTRALAVAEQADGRPPWLEHDERAWAALDRGASRRNGGGPTPAATHGPVYYGALTAPYHLTAGASLWSQLTALRAASALLAALAVLFVLLAAREVAPGRPLFAVGAALLVALNPMFTFIGASVNNDVGYNAAAALLLWLMLRAVRRGLTVPLALAIGVTLGVLPVIKGTAYAMYVVAIVALLALVLARRDRRVLIGVAAVAAAVVLVQLGWGALAAELGRTTFTTPGGAAPVSAGGLWSNAGTSIAYIWQIFLPPLPFMTDYYPTHDLPAYTIYVKRAWASFGWYTIEFHPAVYLTLIAGMGATVVSGLAFARRRGAWLKQHWVAVATLVLMPAIVIVAVEHAYATAAPRQLVAEMGRYLFPAVGALAILASGAFWAFGERWAVRITSGVVVALIMFSFASQLLLLRGFYT
jgi:hypothetical protein